MLQYKRILVLIVAVLGITLVSIAQEVATDVSTDKNVAVCLKNGHMVFGEVIEYNPLHSVTVRQADGTETTIEWNLIKVIKKSNAQPLSAFTTEFVEGKGPQRGVRAMIDGGYGFFVGDHKANVDDRSHQHIEVNAVVGYQLLPCLFLGAGAGLYHFTKQDVNAYPVFGDVRLDFLRNNITPFLDLRLGKAFGSHSMGRVKYGMMFRPSVGCRFGLKGRLALNVQLGMTLCKVKSTHIAVNDIQTLTLSAGIEF